MPVDRERIPFLLGEVEKTLRILKEFQEEEKAKIIGDPKSPILLWLWKVVLMWTPIFCPVNTVVCRKVMPMFLPLLDKVGFPLIAWHKTLSAWLILYRILQHRLYDIDDLIDCIAKRCDIFAHGIDSNVKVVYNAFKSESLMVGSRDSL